MISLRLKEIADLVPNNSSIINVGTDHGLLEIYLTLNKSVSCIGTDINKCSVEKAIENVRKNNLEIPILEKDGLNDIILNNEIIIISGLGTKTILQILNKKINNDLIIQSNNSIEQLKRKIKRKHYYIYKEKKIYDKKWYTILYFKKKKLFTYHKTIKNTNIDYVKYLISLKEKELKKMPRSEFIKRIHKKIIIKKLRLSVKT